MMLTWDMTLVEDIADSMIGEIMAQRTEKKVLTYQLHVKGP